MLLGRGFNDYLSKPIDTIKLNAVMEKWIPKEKHRKPAAVLNGASNADTAAARINIAGVDTERGVAFSGGVLEYYIEILSTFHEDGTERIKGLKECIETKNMELYGTYVHALKSASGGIGAGAISAAAAELEALADKGDFEAVKVLNPRFISDFELLLDRVSKALIKHKGDGTEMETDESEPFKTALASLKDALQTMNPEAVNQAADALQRCAANGHAAIVRAILGKIMMVDYDEAEELIDELL
jgi:HPt (histidine-containing phosphotransfer) domain-containing protein